MRYFIEDRPKTSLLEANIFKRLLKKKFIIIAKNKIKKKIELF